MARPKENNFTRPIKDRLAQTVAYRCSKPDCRIPTIGPKANNQDADSIGRAAHICAASPNGPRYDASMTAEQISSFNNGIWLCANHASEVDSDWANYSKETLISWKEQAIEKARAEKGNKLPSNNDAINTLSIAMGGSPTQIPSMIANVHMASELSLQELDPRFVVKSSYFNNVQHFEVHAKENVSLQLSITPQDSGLFTSKYSNWMDYGEELEVDTSEISVEGSKLFQNVFSQKGKLVFGAPQKDAVAKLWVINSDGQKEHIEDLSGKISLGNKGFEFKGFTSSKLLSVSIKNTNLDSNSADFNISLDLTKWYGKDITTLPYFEKIRSFFDWIGNDGEFFIELEIEGTHLLTTKQANVHNNDYFKYISCYLTYTNAAIVLAKLTKQVIQFRSQNDFSDELYYELLELQQIAEGKAIITKEQITSKITFNMFFENQEQIDAFQNAPASSVFKLHQTFVETITIFGQDFKLPHLVVFMSPVQLITNGKPTLGKSLEVEVLTLEGFQLIRSFDLEI